MCWLLVADFPEGPQGKETKLVVSEGVGEVARIKEVLSLLSSIYRTVLY